MASSLAPPRPGPRLALLFDLDGTLLDSDPLHLAAFRQLLGEHGRSITEGDYARHVMGGANAAIMRYLFPEQTPEAHAELADRKEALFREALDHAHPKAGLIDLLDWADAHRVAICVVTNAPRANAEAMLRCLGLEERLQERVIGEELLRGKPDPMPYLEGLRRLGVDAAQALAFEDSAPGVTAASRAGIRTYGMRGGLDDAALRVAGAAETIADFADEVLRSELQRRLAP